MCAKFYIFVLLTLLTGPVCAEAQERHDPISSPLAVKSFMGGHQHMEELNHSPRSDPTRSGSTIRFRVRTVQATGELLSDQNATDQRVIDPNLSDLTDKFKKLPFKTFRLMGSYEQVVPVKKKETIRLPNGDMLAVRPLYIDDHRIGIWIKWQDRKGASILDTRMHFNCGESMLTGTDSIYDGGLILAFNVTQQ
jgi:hypothetical protein